MNSLLSHTNQRFSDLAQSSEFLDIILNNITSCVLLLDKDMKLRAFNDPLSTIFTNKRGENLLYVRCGEAIGCAYQIEEEKDCGKTSQCEVCELRIAGLTTYATGEVIYKERITRPYFDHQNNKIEKHLQFSTRLFNYKGERYILMIIDDITKLVNLENENKKNKKSE